MYLRVKNLRQPAKAAAASGYCPVLTKRQIRASNARWGFLFWYGVANADEEQFEPEGIAAIRRESHLCR
jgi:hypothetical protein